MKFINSTLAVGIIFFGTALFAQQEAPKYNCIEASNRVFDKHGLPEFDEENMFMHEQSQAVDYTSGMPMSGFGTLDNGRGYRISNNQSRHTFVVDIADPILDDATRAQPVAVDDGNRVGERKKFRLHFPKFKKDKKQQKEARSDLYRYSFNVVGNECHLNQVEISSNVGRESPITAENTVLVDANICQGAGPDSSADIKVKSVCSWFPFYSNSESAVNLDN